MSTLQERIKEVLAAGYKPADLARMTGQTSTTVSYWRHGPTKTIKGANAIAIEKGTGFSARWLEHGMPPKMTGKIPSNATNLTVTERTESLQSLPVVEWGKGVEMLEVDNQAVGLLPEAVHFTAPGAHSAKAKFFVVPDDAMAPDIVRGEYVALDPEVQPLRGDYVLVMNKVGDLLLRQFRPVEGLENFNATPRNTDKFDPLNSKEHGLQWVATLVGHWSGRRSERH